MKTEQEIQQMISALDYLMERENNKPTPDYECYINMGTIKDVLKYILNLSVNDSAFIFMNILEKGIKK